MYTYTQIYDVLVIGGGHAGVEAAGAAARMGAKTLLVTHNIETIGIMSCNPAIGGLGKTHLVKEVDALDGYMARAADAAAIHKRVLNTSKGVAVQAVRSQSCRELYRQAIRKMVESTPGLDIFQAEVADLVIENDKVCGVMTKDGMKIHSKATVLTTGTFLAGKIHIGNVSTSGGRSGDASSELLAHCLGKVFSIGRLKTGTPPRIAVDSLDLSKMEIQSSELDAPDMSYMSKPQDIPQRHCYITHTNKTSHEIIKRYMSESPIFQKRTELMGPRYCPSIEQKVDRFPDKETHQIFVEPEGLISREVYPNGISTSLPFEAQVQFVQTIKGFENARITRPGYAIAYGYFDPRGLKSSLETKQIDCLFFAGQINGTTGYEEAAAQGIMAGINAALTVSGKPTWKVERSQGYIGVLIDDLVTNGTIEPYRMFTSRAEFRLILRCDNAHYRLTEEGYKLGVVTEGRFKAFKEAQQNKTQAWAFLLEQKVKSFPSLLADYPKDAVKRLVDWAKQPGHSVDVLLKHNVIDEKAYAAFKEAMVEAHYEGYIEKQKVQIKRMQSATDMKIPKGFNYREVKGLSSEILEKLEAILPSDLGQAGRISGVTPSALSLLAIYIRKLAA